MDNLNKVPSSGTTFGKVVDAVNENFGLILTAITELEQTNKRKYLFTNEAELKATYPNPDKGDYAFVGDLANALVYKCTNAGTWTKTSEKWNVGGTIDVTAYVSPSDPITEITQLVATKVRMLQNKGEAFLPATSTKAVLDPETKKTSPRAWQRCGPMTRPSHSTSHRRRAPTRHSPTTYRHSPRRQPSISTPWSRAAYPRAC